MNIDEWSDALHPIINGHVPHPNFDSAYQELITAISIHRPGDIIVLSGTSGTGKTTMINKLFNSKVFKRTETNVPAIRSIFLNSDHNNQIDPKWLAKSLLSDIGNPGFAIEIGEETARLKIDLYPRKSTTDLYLTLSNEIKSKKTAFIVIDEASHLGFSPATCHNPVPLMSRLKTFAEDNQLCLILTGTHETLDMISKTTHLHRRSNNIFLKHYDIKLEQDRKNFHFFIKSFEEHIPGMASLNSQGDLSRILMKGSAGSPGFALNWITTACCKCASLGLSELSLECILAKSPSKRDVELREREAAIASQYYPSPLDESLERWNWQPSKQQSISKPDAKPHKTKRRSFASKRPRKVSAMQPPGKRGF